MNNDYINGNGFIMKKTEEEEQQQAKEAVTSTTIPHVTPNNEFQRTQDRSYRSYSSYSESPEENRTYNYGNTGYQNMNNRTNTGYQESNNKKKLEKKKGFLKKAVGMTVAAAMLGCVAGGAFWGINRAAEYIFYDEDAQTVEEPEVPEVVTTTTSSSTSTTVTDVTKVVENVMPSVVSITTTATEVAQSFFGQSYQYETQGSGSGIIVGQSDTELLIATNNHVVEGSDTLTVYFINDDTATAKIKGTDSDMDLAVIAVDLSTISSETLGQISVATLGDSDALQVGEPAVAIGNALGYGQSVTTGVISALNRAVDEASEEESKGFIQTDAAINAGNSGGALLNIQGQVIGINSMKISSNSYGEASVEGMGYAIPISAAKPIIDELMNKETRDKVAETDMGYLGIRGATVGDEMHEVYNMPYGIFVSEVVPGSAAEQAGLLSGDVIVKFDGTKISSYEELQNQLQYYSAGETIELVVQRTTNGAYTEQTISITLGSRSEVIEQ
ncbi:MAG: trypsin-like peptidase domain-containing protein [Lachnospiraceae bacterium]|nr:trypsin-like peptidase domain-containing protein [Lachnospiraceae bacterium]